MNNCTIEAELQAKLADLLPRCAAFDTALEQACRQVAEAFGLPHLGATIFDASVYGPKIAEGMKPTKAATAYENGAHKRATQKVLRCSHQLEAQKDTADASFLALSIVNTLMRSIITIRASVVRMEFAANEGAFANGSVDNGIFGAAANAAEQQLNRFEALLADAKTGEEVAKALSPWVCKGTAKKARKLCKSLRDIYDALPCIRRPKGWRRADAYVLHLSLNKVANQLEAGNPTTEQMGAAMRQFFEEKRENRAFFGSR